MMIYLLLFIYCLNLFYVSKKGLHKSSFIIHFFFISLIFIGPAIYYELGGLTYSHSFEWEDVITFELYGISVFTCSLLFAYFLAHKRKGLFNRYFVNYNSRNLNITFLYFLFWYILVLLYLLVYYNHIPIVRFILTGSLPERLDQSDSVKLFYTFSSFFMVFIPSGYFFFVRYLKTNLLKFGLLILVVFILTSGGHKGLVTFFAIFAIFFSGFKLNLKYISIGLLALSGLLTIYVLSKGRDFNKETFLYLLESPPRRFFVTQGSAFITRISMNRKDLYIGNVNDYQLVKRETFQAIYPGVNEKGAAPTIFLGDIHVKYGYIFTIFSYLLFLMFIFPFVKGLDNMKERRLYLWWNLFVFFLLLGNAELSYTSALRCLLALGNLAFILMIPTLRLRKDET